jgi:heat-inducible transcriptional repressor
MSLSPATIRNVMARLEEAGLLYAPHTSAGRIPTEAGLKLFVHGILEVGDLSLSEQKIIEERCSGTGLGAEHLLEKATFALSGLSHCAGLVIAPKNDPILKHVEFVYLEPGKALVILVTYEGNVENRVIDIPKGLPASCLTEAANYMNARLLGLTLEDAKQRIEKELSLHRTELNEAAKHLIEEGLAKWVGTGSDVTLIVQGHSNLLNSIQHVEELDRIKRIFSILDTKEGLINLLDASIDGDGVQIYIGSQSDLFQLSGCSLVMAPYRNAQGHIIGTVGVIGPTRINYARIIPMVDYTSKVISRLIG